MVFNENDLIEDCLAEVEVFYNTIYQIADEVGIGDYKYFVSVFEKYAGMSPTNYRKIVNQKNEGE